MNVSELPIVLTTDFVQPTQFCAHGNVKVATDGSGLVVYFASGPFNREIVDALEDLEHNFLTEVKTQCGEWSELIIFSQSCAMGPDVVEALSHYFRRLREENLGQKASAIVFLGNVEGRKIFAPMMIKMYQQLDILCQIFDSLDTAISWLKSTEKC